MDGVRAARVSFGNATLAVEGDVEPDQVQAAVARAGYRAQPLSRRRGEPQTPFWRRDARSVSTVVSVVLLAVAVAATLAGASRAVAEPLYLLSMAVGGWPIARAALAGLRRRSLDMNVLMTLAAVGAVGIGSYAEGAWVLVLFAVGTTLESYAFDRSRRSVAELMDLAPEQARVLDDDGSEQLVPVEEVTVGTRFARPPGRARPARRRRRRRRVQRRRGADHRRVGAGRQAAGQHRLRRHAERPGRADGARDQAGRRLHAGARRRARRGGPGLARAVGALRRPLRARLHAAGVRRRARRSSSSRSRSAASRHLALPGARAADRRLSVLAGDLDPGRGRLRGRPRRPRRRADQGRRRPSRTSRA